MFGRTIKRSPVKRIGTLKELRRKQVNEMALLRGSMSAESASTAGKVSKTTDIATAETNHTISVVFASSETKAALDALGTILNQIKAKMNA